MIILNYFKPKQIVPSENSEIADLLGPSAHAHPVSTMTREGNNRHL